MEQQTLIKKLGYRKVCQILYSQEVVNFEYKENNMKRKNLAEKRVIQIFEYYSEY